MMDKSERKRIFDSLAVALRYKPVEGDSAPRVVAKGRGFKAERLKEIAREHNIPVHEDAELVRLLSAVEVENEIPFSLFAAIAEILALIYRADEEKRRSSLGK